MSEPFSHIIADWAFKNWPVVGGAGLFILVTLYLVRFWIPTINKRLKDLESKSHNQEVRAVDLAGLVKKSELYENDGSSIYQHRAACAEAQAACQKVICLKVDGLKQKLQEMDASRDETRSELKEIMEALHSNQLQVVAVTERVEQLFTTEKGILKKEIAEAVVSIIKEALKGRR